MLTCSGCRYFDRSGDRDDGRCRRKAPVGRGSVHWPEVSAEDWCGEFAVRDVTLVATDEGIFELHELSAEDQHGLRAALEQMAAPRKEVK